MRKISFLLTLFILSGVCDAFAQKFAHIPGTVVTYQPTATEKYIGSPSLVVLSNGDYLASHDFFGPQSSEWQQAETVIYRSRNQGKSWKKLSTIRGAFWSSLFVHGGELYLIGPDRHHGMVLVRKSTDGGKTWTTPTNSRDGIVATGLYHCAPMPVVEHNGRLWRPMETAHGPNLAWGKRYGAMVMSAPVDANLLDSRSWRQSSILFYDSTYLNGNFTGWLEGNFVVDRENRMWNILRVDDKTTLDEKVAMVEISKDGKKISFDPETGFIPFDGGSKKFVIKYDPISDYYYTLTNSILDKYKKKHPKRNPMGFRNVLMLRKSKDLKNWEDVKIILEHEDVIHHGFQYVDWLFEGNNMIVLSRTAYNDGKVNAKNNHDANFLTFHRIENFRNLSN